MLAHETDRHNDEIIDFGLSQLFQRLFRVRLQPLHRTDSALIRKGVWIGMTHHFSELAHDQVRAGFDMGLIGVAGFFHVALRNTMGTEEHMRLGGVVAVANFLCDELRHRLHIAGMIKPTSDASDRELFEIRIRLSQSLKFTKAGTTGAD